MKNNEIIKEDLFNIIIKEFFSLLKNVTEIKIKVMDGSKKLKPKHLKKSLFFLLVPKDEKIDNENTKIMICKYKREYSTIELAETYKEIKIETVDYVILQDSEIYKNDNLSFFCNEMNNKKEINSFSNFNLIIFKEKK